MNLSKPSSLMLCLLLLIAAGAGAEVPDRMNYQGWLTDSGGNPLDTTVNMTFKIYDGTGTPLWMETHLSVQVNAGQFDVQLGSVVALEQAIFDNPNRWLGITVGTGLEITPWTRLVTSPYAFNAGNVRWEVEDSILQTTNHYGIMRGGASNHHHGATYGFTIVNLGGHSCTTGTDGEDYPYCTVGGGEANTAGGNGATVSGGAYNDAMGERATVGGGSGNAANAQRSTIAGGIADTTDGNSSAIGGGYHNHTSSTAAFSAIPGGYYGYVGGMFSVVLGGHMDTVGDGADYSMVFGDRVYTGSTHRVIFYDGTGHGRLGLNRDDHDGGIDHPIHVGTNSVNGNGAHLTAGGVWTNGSSRTFKEGFEQLDGADVLDRVSRLPMEAWRYRGSEERHIWPSAEDFHEQFDVGVICEDGTRDVQYLAAGDVAGVALIGVQQLYQMMLQNQQKSERIEQLEARLAQLEGLVATVVAAQNNANHDSAKLAQQR